MGFCLINNIAVAAAWALERIDRVAIVDWDVHHGNGTQDIFYEDSRVLYCSVHQWNAFPGTGRLEEAGRGKGSGCTLNVPLPPGSTGADYALVFSEVFIPAMLRFNPELILVSAGQDILADDPLGGMAVEPENTGALTRMLITAVLSPLALILEGGYGPSHGAAINAIYRALQGEAIASPAGEAGDMTGRIVREARTIHRL
jgi:acetoin utilization deacetylase AcuC-like enzyme